MSDETNVDMALQAIAHRLRASADLHGMPREAIEAMMRAANQIDAVSAALDKRGKPKQIVRNVDGPRASNS